MLKEALTAELVTTDLAGRNKHEVIEALMELVHKSGKVKDKEAALRDVLAHEAEMSTGMEHGVAIPHAKTEAVSELVACVGVSRHKVDFECLDRKPSQIFVMTLSPIDGTGPHVQFLSEISRLLRDGKIRKRILKAKSNEELLGILVS